MKRGVLLRISSLVAVASALDAQSGLVTSANQPIPGATVTATQGDSKVVATTDQNGRYALRPLPKGAWTIEVTMFGFEPASEQVTDPESSRRLDFTLTLKESPVRARLSRSAGAREQNSSPLEAQIGNEANGGNQTQALPGTDGQTSNETFLVSGSLSQGLSPGAPTDSVPAQQSPGFRNGPWGQPGGAQSAQAPTAPGFGAGRPGGLEAGRRGLGGAPDTRSDGRGGRPGGGAQFGNRRPRSQIWGMVFATLDNSALNAKSFSITGQDISQPAYAQARFGVMLGGPLTLPKITQDQSAFFSLSYFATRARNPYTAVETVPLERERSGDFSQALQSGRPVILYDPSTHQPFPGKIIPADRLDPIAQKLLGYLPLPNQPGAVNNFEFQTSAPQDTDNFGLRVQRNITSKDRIWYHLGLQRRDGEAAQPFGFLDSTKGIGLATDLVWTRNLSSTLINNARVSFNRNRNETLPFFAYGRNIAAEFGIAGTSRDPINYGPPNLNFTNFGALSDAAPILRRNQSQTFGDSVILARGKHSFTLGAQFTRNDLNTRTDQNGRGTLNFTGLATSAFTATGAPAPGTGFDLADFLLGLPQSSSIRYGESSTYFRQNVWSGYTQDDWKIRTDLTIHLGVRYEYFSPFEEKYGRIANLDIAPGFTAVGVVTPGAAGPYSGVFPAGLINPDYNNFAPRLGLAWKVPEIHRSTIVRFGYGIYYNGQAYNGFALKLAQQPPFAVSNSVNTSAANVLTLAEGFVSTAPGDVTNTYAVDRKYRTPYAQTWSATIQHELPAGFFIELGYLGTKGTRLDILTVPKEGPSVDVKARHQLGNAVGFTFGSSTGNSIYHAFQARLQRRFRQGIAMNAFYTFSKSIDDSSTFGGAGNTVTQNWLDLAAERGLSSFDRRHALTMNWVWTSPFGADGSRFASDSLSGRFLKDWQFSGSLTAETGAPLTARILGNSARLAQTGGIGSGRAEATGASVASGSGFFNLAAFTVPPPGEFGNAGRNTIPGPGLFSLNLAVARSFRLGESRRRLELRLEGNNALNHVNYTNIGTVVNATNYGLPLSAASMRVLTAVWRFRF